MKIIRPLTITDGMLTYSNIAEDDYPIYSATASYSIGARVMLVDPDTHKTYASLQDENVNHNPATSPTYWVEEGRTNRWKMFDASITSQASNMDSIVVSVAAKGIANGIALLNIDCASIRVTASDPVEGIVFDRTVNPAATSGINDWYSYFLEPIVRVNDIAFTDLPVYSDLMITVTLTNVGRLVFCGGLVIGHAKAMGITQRGAKISLADYSVKGRDSFGNFNVVERAFSRRVTLPLWLDASAVDQTFNLLARYRATPIVYIGIARFGSTVAYGFYKDLSIDIPYKNYAVCSLEIEGLT
ncbi:hypothetical protein [Janthinobacterium aquaticum]|uniref:hypothetical protein n=1 Tax=Janthinobacterium sp. FT58W TaxID=2654254 RepID=UPI0012659B60|nr:hypothetical protein [Janthinobacterium sp. FT58W]KAB8037415.1 hypothetical protein GCM43_23710 [Janthinobacterium sp. FT58W]